MGDAIYFIMNGTRQLVESGRSLGPGTPNGRANLPNVSPDRRQRNGVDRRDPEFDSGGNAFAPAGSAHQPFVAVRNVRASSRWYTELLGADSLPEHSHRDVYDRISSAGQLLLQLHAWDAEDHPNLVNAAAAPPGHGVLLWFQVLDFDSVVERARRLNAEIIEEPHVNSGPRHREIWIRDSDGYVVVVASPDGECGA